MHVDECLCHSMFDEQFASPVSRIENPYNSIRREGLRELYYQDLVTYLDNQQQGYSVIILVT